MKAVLLFKYNFLLVNLLVCILTLHLRSSGVCARRTTALQFGFGQIYEYRASGLKELLHVLQKRGQDYRCIFPARSVRYESHVVGVPGYPSVLSTYSL
jgi:hypothetical protein